MEALALGKKIMTTLTTKVFTTEQVLRGALEQDSGYESMLETDGPLGDWTNDIFVYDANVTCEEGNKKYAEVILLIDGKNWECEYTIENRGDYQECDLAIEGSYMKVKDGALVYDGTDKTTYECTQVVSVTKTVVTTTWEACVKDVQV